MKTTLFSPDNNYCKHHYSLEKVVNKTSLTFLFLLVANLIINISFSQAASISQALESAIQNNPDISLEKSRLNKVRATKGDAITEFLPEITAAYQRGKQQNDDTTDDRGVLDDTQDQDYRELSVTQPLFNGFKGYNKAKEVKYNIKQAGEYYKVKRDQILLSAIETYLNLYKARKTLDLKISNKEKSEKLLKLIKQRNRLGQVEGNEVIIYQTKLSSAILEEFTAEKDLFKTREEYNKIIGRVDYNLTLPEILANKIPGDEQQLTDIVTENNSNLKQYKFKINSAKSALNQAKGSFLPTVEIAASLSEQQNVTYLSNHDLRSKSVYLNVSIPIFQKGAEYFDTSKANRELQFARDEHLVNKQNLIKETRQNYREYLFNKSLLKSNNDLVEINQSRLNKIKDQVNAGSGDIIDLINTQIELNNILEQKLGNEIDHILGYYKLLMLMDKLQL